jgi:superfamily II DNA or RNA helicase
VNLLRGCAWSGINRAAQEERRWLEDYLTVEQTVYTPSVGREVQRVSVLTPHGLFPAGLTGMVTSAAVGSGLQVALDDRRGDPPCAVDGSADLRWLRPYQLDAVRSVAAAGGGIVKIPTGGGKTEVFFGLTLALPCQWLFVVHRSDLVAQTARRYRARLGEVAGTFDSSGWRRGSSNVTVATFQSVMAARRHAPDKLEELLEGVHALNVDEVHAQPADTFYATSLLFESAYYRVGMSATPLDRSDLDTLRTVGAIGPVAHEMPAQELIDAGVLARPTIHVAVCNQPATNVNVTWRKVYEQLVVRSRARNELLAAMAERAEKPCLLFVDEADHAARLVVELSRRGMRAAFAHGGDSLEARRRKLEQLVAGRHDVLVCTVIFQEGIDVPELRSVVVAGGKSSAVATLQRLGRGMRCAAGKSEFQLWDVLDRGQSWLEAHADLRLRAYRREGHKVVKEF